MIQILELRAGGLALAGPLAAFFDRLRDEGDERRFHPHPLTREEAEVRVRYDGQDLYYALADGDQILGYGMLRGWDDGYVIPSLGIAVHPDERGRGLARLLMLFLHTAARRRGADQVRLTVDAGNGAALHLYRELGYAIREMGDGRLEGILRL